MDGISTATDENLITATMCIDLSAAFDCVSHETLKSKLSFYGLDQATKDWISSYLDSRSFFVSIGSANSRIIPTSHGVPQGSVMGPMLYLLYVNEMTTVMEDDDCSEDVHQDRTKLFSANCRKCGVFPMFADDGMFQFSSNFRYKNQLKIEDTFWKLKSFLNANGLQVNDSKTSLTEFMCQQKRTKTTGIPPDLTVEETTTNRRGQRTTQDKLITDKTSLRILGLNFENNLTWNSHLNTGRKSALPAVRKSLGMISRLSQNIGKKAKLQLVNSLSMSKLSYGLNIWGHTTENHLRKAQVVQNTAARLVTGLSKLTRQHVLLKECGWLNLQDWTELQSLCQLWKTVRWGIPDYLNEKITRLDEDKLTTKLPRLMLTEATFRCRSIKYWNALPEYLRTEMSQIRFKKCLKRFLIDRADDRELARTNRNADEERPP